IAAPEAVPACIAGAIGLDGDSADPLADVVDRLRQQQRVLIVLDNCEHVVADVAPVVHELMARCSALHILATSREPLAVAGEALWPLAPLAPMDALALFVARAADVAPGACVDDDARATARRICQHLDGLPLAIELAAARMRVFTPSDLLARLDDRFRLLTAGPRTAAPRQQTLRAVVDWSHDLLGDDERTVFARASVFVGPFDLDAAEQVCGDGDSGGHGAVAPPDVADVLARLVDKSLVVAVVAYGHTRFRLLQTLAQYGAEQLRRTDAEHATRTRHAWWVASFAEVPDPEHGRSSQHWFAGFTDALGDVHAAMEWSLRVGDADLALAIADGLGWYWQMGGRVEATWTWLVGALDLGEPHVRARRVRVLAWAGAIGVGCDTERAMAFGVEAVNQARVLGDAPAWAHATMRRGAVLADFLLQRKAAAELLEESEGQLIAVADDWSLAEAALLRGAALLLRGDYAAAGVELRCSADRFQAIANPWGAAIALRNLADVAIPSGRYDEAVAVLQEAISALHAVGAICISGELMARLAYVYGLQGRVAEADAWHERAMTAAKEQRLAPVLGLTHNLRGDVLRRQRRLDEAETCHRRALALYRQHHDVAGTAYAHTSLGFVAELRGDDVEAQSHHSAALRAAREIEDPRSTAAALEGLAGVASLRGHAERTGMLLGAATALRERMRVPLVAAERADIERAEGRFADRSDLERAYRRGFTRADAVATDAGL
ncbi:MAG TPA: tetratricopeptide repeat protein, partial [Acidimicrobiia bacterium]